MNALVSIVAGLLLGGSWFGCAAIGYRIGKDQGRADETLDRIKTARESR